MIVWEGPYCRLLVDVCVEIGVVDIMGVVDVCVVDVVDVGDVVFSIVGILN